MITKTRYDFDRLEKFLDMVAEDIHPEKEDNSHFIDKGMSIFSKYVKSGDKILDIGCGYGYAMSTLSNLGAMVTGVTLNGDDFQRVTTLGYDVRVMDMSFLEFEKETFDLIWARQSLEHSIFPYFTLSGWVDVMKTGGYIYLEMPVPGMPSLNECDVNHYSVMGETMWFYIFNKVGLKIIDHYYISFNTTRGDDKYVSFVCKKERND